MRFCISVLLMFATLGALPATADVVTIDFETFPDGTPIADGKPITTQFPGLTFADTTVITAGLSLNEFEFPPHSGTNVAFDDGGPISISFAFPVLTFGAYFTYQEPLLLTAFDATGASLAAAASAFSNNEAISGDPGSSPNEFLEVSAPAGIADVTIAGDPAGASFTMDDLTYTAVTPEPSTIWQVATFFIALLMYRSSRLKVRRSGQHSRPALKFVFVMVLASTLPRLSWAQAPAVLPPGVQPAAVTVNVPTAITITSRITASNVVPGSVNVQLLNAQGQPESVVGLLNDNGVLPDLVADDGVYSGTISINESQTGSIAIRVSAAIRGSLLRVASAPVSIDVLPPGIPTAPAIPDPTQVTVDPLTGNSIIGNEVLACFSALVGIDAIKADASLVGATIIGRFSGLGNCYQFGLSSQSTGATVDSAVATLNIQPGVTSAAPDTLFTTTEAWPPYCLACGTPAYEALRLSDAHIVTTGANTKVAVLDSGIDPYYAMVNPNVVLGPDETNPLGSSLVDPTGHGTEVAGIVGATAPASRIYIVRVVVGSTRTSPTPLLAKGIMDAADYGVNVINISLAVAGNNDTQQDIRSFEILGDAVTYAQARNVVVVAGAGNGIKDDCNPPYTTAQFPAAFSVEFSNVLSVAATNGSVSNDQLWQCSNYGPWVNIAAPGVNIQSNGVPASRAKTDSGTSLSAPFVAGTAALVSSVNANWSSSRIVSQLEQTATMITGAQGQSLTFGRINPAQQVTIQVTGPGSVSSSDGKFSSCSSTCMQWYLGSPTVTLTAQLGSGATVTWGGNCANGGSNAAFQLMLTGDKTCTAMFQVASPPYTLTTGIGGSGKGTITIPPGVNCSLPASSPCTASFPAGPVRLIATPDPNSVFGGWFGDCSGGDLQIVVALSGDMTCFAEFGIRIYITIESASCAIVGPDPYFPDIQDEIIVGASGRVSAYPSDWIQGVCYEPMGPISPRAYSCTVKTTVTRGTTTFQTGLFITDGPTFDKPDLYELPLTLSCQ